MNENVQMFLEANIELVDDCAWKELFTKSQDPNEGLTNNDFILLLEILKTIGINFSESQFLNLFCQVMKDEIKAYFQYELDEKEEVFWWLRHVPNNCLGYEVLKAKDIFLMHPAELGIIIESNGYQLIMRLDK